MLDNQQVYAQVNNLYKQVQHGKLNISSAITKIQEFLAKAGVDGNENAQTMLNVWDSQVDIHPKIYFVNKIKHDLPTLYNDEYNFDRELGIGEDDAKADSKIAVEYAKDELKLVQKLPNVLLQYNGNIGHVEIAQASGLAVLVENLRHEANEESPKKPD